MTVQRIETSVDAIRIGSQLGDEVIPVLSFSDFIGTQILVT